MLLNVIWGRVPSPNSFQFMLLFREADWHSQRYMTDAPGNRHTWIIPEAQCDSHLEICLCDEVTSPSLRFNMRPSWKNIPSPGYSTLTSKTRKSDFLMARGHADIQLKLNPGTPGLKELNINVICLVRKKQADNDSYQRASQYFPLPGQA